MAYAIINKFIPTSKYGLKAPYTMKPQYVTIHNTANDATALNEIAYMTRNNNATSYHVAIDDKHAVQAIPFSRNAWHCGDGATGNGNRKSIGLEICYSKSGGKRYADAEANAIEYVAHVLKQYGWGIDKVKWHRDWNSKNCPHRIFAEGRAQQVKNRIATRLKELNGDIVEPAAPKPSPTKQKEVDEMTRYMDEKLPLTQREDFERLFEQAYKDDYFGLNHAPNVKNMTRRQVYDLKSSLEIREKLNVKVERDK